MPKKEIEQFKHIIYASRPLGFDEETVNHQQQQKDLDHLLLIIEDAGTVIVEKLALFKKYNRKVRSRVRCMVINGHLRK